MRALWAIALLGTPTLAVTASAQAREAAPWQNWQTSLHASEALVGKIWSVGEKRFITPRQLAGDVAQAKYVVMGETHDNADHHRLQAWLIDKIAVNAKPAIVMEMINLDQSEALAAYLARPGANAAGLGPALGWAASGWPRWPMYQPIAEAVFRAGLPLLPGDPGRAAIRRLASDGLDAIDGAEQKRLALDQPLSPRLAEALNQDIRDSHCNLLPQAMLGPMTQVQRFRDAALADALIKAGVGAGAILITGNGHARSDRGVPWYLARRDGGARVATVMLVEIAEGAKTVEELAAAGPDGKPAADYLWVTPGAERQDQCEKLRQRFGK